MGRFSIFPKLLPDETVYSWIARYHLLSGNTSRRETLKEVVGNESTGINLWMGGSNLTEIARNVSRVISVSTERLLLDHTAYAFVTFFAHEEGAQKLTSALCGKTQAPIATILGWRRLSPRVSVTLQYCPVCAEEDEESHGTVYWHQSHLLPSVTACHKHGVSLQKARDVAQPEAALLLPPSQLELNSGHELQACTEPELTFAKWCHWLLQMWPHGGALNLALAYSRRLKSKGLQGSSKLHYGEIAKALVSHYGEDFLKQVVQTNSGDGSEWTHKFFRDFPKYNKPYCQHILVIGMLFRDREDLQDVLFDRPPGAVVLSRRAPSSKAPQPRKPKKNPSWLVGRIRQLCGSLSVTQMAAELSIGETTVRSYMDALDGEESGKGPNWKKLRNAKLLKLILTATKLAELAKDERVHFTVIMALLAMHPEVAAERATRIYTQERAGLEAEIRSKGRDESSVGPGRENSPEESVRMRALLLELRDTRIYREVMAREAEWLNRLLLECGYGTHLEVLRPKGQRPRTINTDWAARDVALEEEVGRVCKEIREREGRPVRITVKTIARELKKPMLTREDALAMLPHTSKALGECVESMSSYNVRVLAWAREELQRLASAPLDLKDPVAKMKPRNLRRLVKDLERGVRPLARSRAGAKRPRAELLG